MEVLRKWHLSGDFWYFKIYSKSIIKKYSKSTKSFKNYTFEPWKSTSEKNAFWPIDVLMACSVFSGTKNNSQNWNTSFSKFCHKENTARDRSYKTNQILLSNAHGSDPYFTILTKTNTMLVRLESWTHYWNSHIKSMTEGNNNHSFWGNKWSVFSKI